MSTQAHTHRDYSFIAIEKKWNDYFDKNNIYHFNIDDSKPKYYVLEMFPYPSGKIHMGHVRNYTIGDMIARFKHHQGFNVLHPIGWDAFGLPAENAAIDNDIHPAKWTFSNIDEMRNQLIKLGFFYDWKKEICTAKPNYYQWGQWFFVKMYKKGLVYKKKSQVNWCPKCNTVLANEQLEDGKCWRHPDTLVEKKELEQWYFKLTDYAEELLEGHKKLQKGWPEKVITMQKNWIGKSHGAEINFFFQKTPSSPKEPFPIFTTRPDTTYGVSYMAIAFDHPDLKKYLNLEVDEKSLEDFIARSKQLNQKADYEKEGFFTGSYVIHPLTNEKIHLYIANFVLGEYGTGAVMAVPAHDQRDFEFAKKYGLPIKIVIQNEDNTLDPLTMEKAHTGDGLLVNSGEFNGLSNKKAIEVIIEKIENLNLGRKRVHYKLKDWLISRQRYWGNPIPIIYCDDCGCVPVPEKDLPVLLPEDVDFTKGKNPLEYSLSFKNTPCPSCGKQANRETDTMDTFTCSSWYFLRYIDPFNLETAFSSEKANHWLPVNQYIGGIEHACMHLLYARFFHKVIRDLGLVKKDEPFSCLLTQGMVVGPSYYDPKTKKYFNQSELKNKQAKHPTTGDPLIVKIEKMSKSKNNGVNPDDIVSSYGADTVRLFSLFAAPPEKDLEWNEKGVEGCHRFIKRLWKWVMRLSSLSNNLPVDNLGEKAIKMRSLQHKTIKKVTKDIEEKHQFNTAIASMMEMLNIVGDFTPKNSKETELAKEIMKTTLILLNPFIPFVTEELGEHLKLGELVCKLPWPKFNEVWTIDEEITVVFQINGKVRTKANVTRDLNKEALIQLAQKNPIVQKWIEGREVIKEIIVPNKLVNIVVK